MNSCCLKRLYKSHVIELMLEKSEQASLYRLWLLGLEIETTELFSIKEHNLLLKPVAKNHLSKSLFVQQIFVQIIICLRRGKKSRCFWSSPQSRAEIGTLLVKWKVIFLCLCFIETTLNWSNEKLWCWKCDGNKEAETKKI